MKFDLIEEMKTRPRPDWIYGLFGALAVCLIIVGIWFYRIGQNLSTDCASNPSGIVLDQITPTPQQIEPEVIIRPTPQPISHWYTVNGSVNLRLTPSVESPILLVLNPGTPIILLDGVNDDWREVSGSGKTGWIKAEYIEIRDD